jgi:hypothetical protein
MSNRCNACGKLFTDHMGIVGTCQENLRLRAALIALLSLAKYEYQLAGTHAFREAERVLDGNETEQGIEE